MMNRKMLFGALALATFASASCASAQVPVAAERVTCKLTNTDAHAVIYEGACTVTQEVGSDGSTIFDVQMGSAQSFRFAGRRGDPNWMTGPDRVHFTDLPNGGIFHWGSFALVIAED